MTDDEYENAHHEADALKAEARAETLRANIDRERKQLQKELKRPLSVKQLQFRKKVREMAPEAKDRLLSRLKAWRASK